MTPPAPELEQVATDLANTLIRQGEAQTTWEGHYQTFKSAILAALTTAVASERERGKTRAAELGERIGAIEAEGAAWALKYDTAEQARKAAEAIVERLTKALTTISRAYETPDHLRDIARAALAAEATEKQACSDQALVERFAKYTVVNHHDGSWPSSDPCRIVGFRIPEATAGLSKGIFDVQRLVAIATTARSEGFAAGEQAMREKAAQVAELIGGPMRGAHASTAETSHIVGRDIAKHIRALPAEAKEKP